jgi:hypothetical protein
MFSTISALAKSGPSFVCSHPFCVILSVNESSAKAAASIDSNVFFLRLRAPADLS